MVTQVSTTLFSWIFELIRSAHEDLVHFVLQFVPVLLWVHLTRSLASLPSPGTSRRRRVSFCQCRVGIYVILRNIAARAPRPAASDSVWAVDTVLTDLSNGSIYHAKTANVYDVLTCVDSHHHVRLLTVELR